MGQSREIPTKAALISCKLPGVWIHGLYSVASVDHNFLIQCSFACWDEICNVHEGYSKTHTLFSTNIIIQAYRAPTLSLNLSPGETDMLYEALPPMIIQASRVEGLLPKSLSV